MVGGGNERHLPLVPLLDLCQIVCAAEVQLLKDGGFSQLSQGGRDEDDVVQGSVINARP